MKRLLVFLILPALIAASGAWAAPPTGDVMGDESARIKAAILFALTKVVDWPSGTATPGFVIATTGDSPGGPDLGTLKGKSVGGRPLEFALLGADGGLPGPHILFITGDADERLDQILHGVAGGPVLTVSELDRFCERGGMIQLVERRKKIHMRINRRAAEDAGLRLSSQLLKVAELVEAKGG